MRNYEPNINQSVPNVFATGRDVQDAPNTAGTINDVVLRFNAANDTVSGGLFNIVHSAINGDSVNIERPGIYSATFQFSQAAATTAHFGISLDVAAAGLIGAPLLTMAGMLVTNQSVLVAANSPYVVLAATFAVTRVAAQLIAGATVRFHGSTAAGAVVPDATILENAECAFRVQLVSNIL